MQAVGYYESSIMVNHINKHKLEKGTYSRRRIQNPRVHTLIRQPPHLLSTQTGDEVDPVRITASGANIADRVDVEPELAT